MLTIYDNSNFDNLRVWPGLASCLLRCSWAVPSSGESVHTWREWSRSQQTQCWLDFSVWLSCFQQTPDRHGSVKKMKTTWSISYILILILHFYYYTTNKKIIQIAYAMNTFFPHTHPVGSVSSQLDLFSESTQVGVDYISQCLHGLLPLTQKVDLCNHLRQFVPHIITYKQHNNARKSVDRGYTGSAVG